MLQVVTVALEFFASHENDRQVFDNVVFGVIPVPLDGRETRVSD